MSEDSKVEQTQEVPVQERARGERGELGQPTPSLTIKQRWHQAHFSSDKKGQHKRVWVRKENSPSLKQFAKSLVKSGDTVAKEWLENKAGVKDQARSNANEKVARESAMASRLTRRKSSSKK